MNIDPNVYWLMGGVVAAAWLLSAAIFTIKVLSLPNLRPEVKRQLIVPMWVVPLLGVLFFLLIFVKTGKLRRLTLDEHRSLWVGGHHK